MRLVRCASARTIATDDASAVPLAFGAASNITLTFTGAAEEFAHLDSFAFVL